MVSAGQKAARRGAGRDNREKEVVQAIISRGHTLLLARLAGVDVPEDLRRRVVHRARRHLLMERERAATLQVRDGRHPSLAPRTFENAKLPEQVQSTAREVRPPPKAKASSRLARDDNVPPPAGWRVLDTARMVRELPPPHVVYACRCRPSEDRFGCGRLLIAMRTEGGPA
jgi:hypothetical protein